MKRQILLLRFVGHTFLSDSELELTALTFQLLYAPELDILGYFERILFDEFGALRLFSNYYLP